MMESAKSYLKSYYYDKKYYEKKIDQIGLIKSDVDMLLRQNESLSDKFDVSEKLRKNNEALIDNIVKQEQVAITELSKRISLEQKIENLPQPYKVVLYYRYVLNMEFAQIASELNYTDKRIYQLHGEAVQLLDAAQTFGVNTD